MEPEMNSAAPATLLLARSQLSFRYRIGHLTLLLIAIGASVGLGSLLVTENGLPLRTTVALGALLLVNFCWAAYATWVLTTRRALLFNHRVIASRIAVAAATAFTGGAAVLAAFTRTAASYAAAGSGLGLLVVAIALLMRATRNFRTLQMRRTELEARIGGMAP